MDDIYENYIMKHYTHIIIGDKSHIVEVNPYSVDENSTETDILIFENFAHTNTPILWQGVQFQGTKDESEIDIVKQVRTIEGWRDLKHYELKLSLKDFAIRQVARPNEQPVTEKFDIWHSEAVKASKLNQEEVKEQPVQQEEKLIYQDDNHLPVGDYETPLTEQEISEWKERRNAIRQANKPVDSTPITSEGDGREDYKSITGFNTADARASYEDGCNDKESVIIEWIEKWDGSTNSQLGKLLFDKLTSISSNRENVRERGDKEKGVEELLIDFLQFHYRENPFRRDSTNKKDILDYIKFKSNVIK